MFLGGDSGYGKHLKEIGVEFGPFDWAILENGQYNKTWKYIHAMTEEQLSIIRDLNAQKIMTVHHAKFKLANHNWSEPLEEIFELSKENNFMLATSKIGQIVYLDSIPVSEEWWK